MSAQKTFAHAARWSLVTTWAQQGATAAVTLLLAAMLGPAEFGLASMGMLFILFFQMLTESGLSSALIQREDLRSAHTDSAFWGLLAWGIALGGVAALLAGWWADANDTPMLRGVVLALCPLPALFSLTVVQQSLLKRDLDFRPLAIRLFVSTVSGGVLGVVAAWLGLGVWSLVIQQLASTAIGVAVLWRLSTWRPSFRFSARALRDLLPFSAATFGDSLGVYARNRSDALLLGLFFGPVAVGLYRLADRLMNLVLALTTRAISSVALPHFARSRSNKDDLHRAARQCLRASTSMALPAMAMLIGTAEPLMLLLGPEWGAAAVAIQILAFVGVIQSFTLFTPPMLQAIGKPHYAMLLTWASAFVMIAAIAATATLLEGSEVTTQLLAIASARVAAFTLVYLPANLCLFQRACGVTLADVMASSWPGTLAAVTCIATSLSTAALLSAHHPVAVLASIMAISGPATIGALLLTDPQAARAFRLIRNRVFSVALASPMLSSRTKEDLHP